MNSGYFYILNRIMQTPEHFHRELFSIRSDHQFNDLALQIFHWQRENNPVYRAYLESISPESASITSLEKIPFLPISLFKTHRIYSATTNPEAVFRSSGTAGSQVSSHYVASLAMYEQSFETTFRMFYGDPGKLRILALLPSYVERKDSSLVYMVDRLVRQSGHPESGFYHGRTQELLRLLENRENNTLLIGVTFALLELAENNLPANSRLIIMETGGMKGRRREMVREELHQVLTGRLGVKQIHSEYGMTELLSQAYSKGNGIFYTPPWMRVLIRDANDPLALVSAGKTGGINVIDLANIYSCSFIATEDLGRLRHDGSFEVLGRFEESDIRGCNLLIA